MGYRSDVGLCLSVSATEKLQNTLQEHKNNQNPGYKEITDFLNCADKKEQNDNGESAYYWSCLKWYKDYAEVSFIKSFLSELDDDQHLFICLGESDDDTEIIGSWWDNPFGMSYMRSIIFE